MRLVFPKPKEYKPLEQLLHQARESTGIVLPEERGFKIFLNGGHLYFHNEDSYRDLPPQHLMAFPDLYELLHEKIFHDGIPEHQRSLLAQLMATSEHHDFSPVAIEKLPGYVMHTRPIKQAELGAWGAFDTELAEEAARKKSEEAGREISLEQYISLIMPVFTHMDGQPVLKALLRANRPGANQQASVQPQIQQQVYQSIHYGHPNNKQALKDIINGMMRVGKYIPEKLGQLIDGDAIVLSLDSEENNKKYQSVLDIPFSIESRVRDLSSLSIAGIKAITIINRFSSLARHVDEVLYKHIEKLGIEIPKGRWQLNGKPVLAEGSCLVTYTTGFETDYSQMNRDKVAAMYKSIQLAIGRVMEQPGYEHASFVIGENIGRGAAATLDEKHLQAYVFKHLDVKPHNNRVEPTRENVLYENNSVFIIVHPESYGQVIIQFKEDKDFLERTNKELLDYADARLYNFHVLNKLGVSNDRNVYMHGNDFTVRPVPSYQSNSGLAFFEWTTGRRIISKPNTPPLELIANIPGDARQFAEMYRKAA